MKKLLLSLFAGILMGGTALVGGGSGCSNTIAESPGPGAETPSPGAETPSEGPSETPPEGPSETPGPEGPSRWVAFESSRALDPAAQERNLHDTYNIWIMADDGSEARPLTDLTAEDADSRNPAWSPDRSAIAFASKRSLDPAEDAANPATNVWIVDVDGSNPRPLTRYTAPAVRAATPRWSPDGSTLLFESNASLDGSDGALSPAATNLWAVAADGSSDPAPLTAYTAEQAVCKHAGFSPNGSKIAYVSNGKLDGSDEVLLSTGGTISSVVANLWVMNADGGDRAPLTRFTGHNMAALSPDWSSDGTQIVYAANQALDGSDAAIASTTMNLWVLGVATNEATPLTRATAAGVRASTPRWEPGGERIVYVSNRALNGDDAAISGGVVNLWIWSAGEETPVTRLTAAGAFSASPEWSSDGTTILYTSSRAVDPSADESNGAFNIWSLTPEDAVSVPLTEATLSLLDSFSPVPGF
jgi:Tol biopolymer transport system component